MLKSNNATRISNIIDEIFSSDFFLSDTTNGLIFPIEESDDIYNNLSLEDAYKKAYKNNHTMSCVKILLEMYSTSSENFLKILFFTDCIKSPMGFKYNETDYKRTIKILVSSILYANNTFNELVFVKGFCADIYQLIHYTILFYHNNKTNTEKLLQNKFSSFSLADQLRMICIFFQDQSRLLRESLQETQLNSNFITGMEMGIDNVRADFSESSTSLMGSYEILVEFLNVLIRYLYATKKAESHRDSLYVNNITPYGIPTFEEINHIAYHRQLLLDMESKVRYSQWRIEKSLTDDNQELYLFSPKFKDCVLSHATANLRRRYILTTGTFIQAEDDSEYGDAINKLSKQIDCTDVKTFAEDKVMYNQAKNVVSRLLNAYKNSMNPFYLNCNAKGILVVDIFSAYEYLYTIGQIYITAVYSKFDANNEADYQYLAPIIKTELIVNNFSILYDFENEYAKKLISCFIYDQSIKNDDGDIFSRPLISLGNDKVVFCESLLEQINIERCIEQLLHNNQIDLSPIGRKFEEKLIQSLLKSSTIQVNTNKVDFLAYDGRDVEFDFIGTFEEYLLLFEFKAVTTPYDEKELFNKKQTIKEGVEQIIRRCKIVHNDWDKITKIANIKLPPTPFHDSKIIKLVCTNIFDFTNLVYDGIQIIDESTLLKFFTSPYVGVFKVDEPVHSVLHSERLWKGTQPTVQEFLIYLEKPVTTSFIDECFEETIKTPPCFEEDIPIAFCDYELKEDPFKSAIEKKLGVENNVKSNANTNLNKKIGRNEQCPCGSGQKYKRCCGKNL